MSRITHPTATTGRHYGHFGVIFDNGVADVELTEESRAWYAGRGYGVEDAPDHANLVESGIGGGETDGVIIEGGTVLDVLAKSVPARRSRRK